MNPIPSNALAFVMTQATLPFDATPVLNGLLLVLAVGATVLACAAWWNHPHRAVPRSEVRTDFLPEPSRKAVAASAAQPSRCGVGTIVPGSFHVSEPSAQRL